MIKRNNFIFILLLFGAVIVSCGREYTPEEKTYIKKIDEYRYKKNLSMISNPNSPFNYPEKVSFHPLNYFDVDPDFVFKSKLYLYDNPDTVTIYGTQGEVRSALRFAYLNINYDGESYKLNVYKNFTDDGKTYYSIWFTDETTNKETYGVGRYLDFEKKEDPSYVYTIDFNLAFNPFCAYSPAYSCAIPSKEDHLPFEVRAGEKKFHE